MKNLILPFGLFALFILSTLFACQKQEVDCENYRSTCTYYFISFSDCTPNGSELGWQWDGITRDTVVAEVWGCPDEIEAEFAAQMEEIAASSEDYKHFFEEYPNTCNCN